MEKVRICSIQVEHLFGRLNYNIDLSDNNPISIITAPNGMGKTTILNLLSLMFHPHNDAFADIQGIPFGFIRCSLSNGKTVELRMVDRSGSQPSKKNTARTISQDQAIARAKPIFSNIDYEFSISGKAKKTIVYSEAYQDTLDLSPTEYIDETDEYDLSYRQRPTPPSIRLKYIWKLQNSHLAESGCQIGINYIRADRIQPIQEYSRRYRHDYGEPATISPLVKARDDIEDLIKAATEIYNEDVSRAKDILPELFLKAKIEVLPANRFLEEWHRYQTEVTQFQEIGLIPISDSFTLGEDISTVYEDKKQFLSTYLAAFKDTTDRLKDIYARLYLFKSIFDERNAITGKVLSISKGRIVVSAFGRTLDLESLSSGEKHDFIMFFNLIFKCSPGSLVLIDEPEISLHIAWQESYLDKLKEICELNWLRAIVATHSPNIVSSHYDWLVDKGESEE